MSRDRDDTPPGNSGALLLHVLRARKLLREEQFDLALRELEEAKLAKPGDEEVLNLLSVIEFKRGDYHEAARATRALLKGNPNSAILHSNLGLILFKAGVLGEAEQELRRAVERKPDHARSHLYLGLLYRMQGNLDLALAHLRFAGARRAVTEIEQTLRKTLRGATSSTAVPVVRAVAVGESEHASTRLLAPSAIRPLEERVPLPAETTTSSAIDDDETAPLRLAPKPPEAPAAGADPPRELALGPDAAASEEAGRPLFRLQHDGGLEIASHGAVFVRKGSVVWYSGKMRFAAEPSFRGTRLEKILRADGRGSIFLNDPGRSASRRDLTGESLYVEGSRLLALEPGLSFHVEPIHDFRTNRRVDILKIQGRGSVILSVGGPLLAHQVSSDFPLNVSSRDLVAWAGDLVPSVLEDRFLEEVMMPDAGNAPKICFEGEGTVLTEPPRPRRRASDLPQGPEPNRRN